MSLHEALHDAETGKAQHLQGNSLDTLLDENNRPLPSSEAAKLDLDEGEILKLPPTPENTDGTEYQSDPETTKVHLPSRPGSGASTPSRRMPPSLPPRNSAGVGAGLLAGSTGLRPPLDRNDSSASHYSDALDGGDKVGPTGTSSNGVPSDGPPGYGDDAGVPTAYPAERSTIPAYDHTSAPSVYPVEKRTEPEPEVPGYDYDSAPSVPTQPAYAEQAPTGASATQDMDEGERREWEQFHADQELAQRAGQISIVEGSDRPNEESLR